jgi:tight adherence protein B
MMSFVLIMALIWAVFLGAWFGVSKWFKSADVNQIKSRLANKQEKTEAKKAKKQAALISTEDDAAHKFVRVVKRYEAANKIEELVEQAGLRWKLKHVVRYCLMTGSAGALLSWSLLGDYKSWAPLIGLATGSLPILYLVRLKNKRLKRFEEIFPESLEFVSRSMRAGHAFSVALEMIHREFQEPLAGEFRRTFEEHNLGLPLDVALQKLAKRVPSLDVHFFVSAVMLQKRTGGNLAEILDKLAYIIRERFKLRGKIAAISAHGRMTGAALTSIPIAVAGLMFLVNPEYIRFFFVDEVGNYMLAAAVGLQVIGYLVIRKIVSIEV